MRVLMFGAGASRSAGYPLARNLLTEVGREARRTSSIQFRDAWEEWEAFRERMPATLGLVAKNANPEVVLSLPDLLVAAAETEDEARTSEAIRAYLENGAADAAPLERYFGSEERDALSAAFAPRARLLDALEWYFWGKHHHDGEHPSRRDYLRRVLEELAEGDAVITLNWDTVAERTLAEAGRWNPTDGYGFPRELQVEGPLRKRTALPSELAGESPVRVLKLHGSFGWRRTDSGVYLDSNMLLAEFGFHLRGTPVDLVDAAAPEFYTRDPLLMAHPSFLKRLDHPTMDAIWRQASEALAKAKIVKVWGYSLPEGDGAVRALLQGLSARVRRGEVKVTVHDPSPRVLGRWKALLGEGIETREEAL